MDEVHVFHSRTNQVAADAFVEQLRARKDVGIVSQARSDRWNPAQMPAGHVFHDGSNKALAWACEEAGIPVEMFTESATQVERKAEPLVVKSATDEWPEGYSAERSGSWYTVFASDGEVVGKVQGEAAAIRLAHEHADADA